MPQTREYHANVQRAAWREPRCEFWLKLFRCNIIYISRHKKVAQRFSHKMFHLDNFLICLKLIGHQIDCREGHCERYMRRRFEMCFPCCDSPLSVSTRPEIANCKAIRSFDSACYHYRRFGMVKPWFYRTCKIKITLTFVPPIFSNSARKSSRVLSLAIEPTKSLILSRYVSFKSNKA